MKSSTPTGVRHDVRAKSHMLIVGPARARNRTQKPGELVFFFLIKLSFVYYFL